MQNCNNECLLLDYVREDLVSLGVRTRGVPEAVSGPIRLVEIEGLDFKHLWGDLFPELASLQSVAL